jgi:hypothetical protein
MSNFLLLRQHSRVVSFTFIIIILFFHILEIILRNVAKVFSFLLLPLSVNSGLHLEPFKQPFVWTGFFKTGSHELFAWTGFELQFS